MSRLELTKTKIYEKTQLLLRILAVIGKYGSHYCDDICDPKQLLKRSRNFRPSPWILPSIRCVCMFVKQSEQLDNKVNGHDYLTLPAVLMPLKRQKKTMTQHSSRQSAICHLTEPSRPRPPDTSSTERLQHSALQRVAQVRVSV